jgi:endonuclease-3
MRKKERADYVYDVLNKKFPNVGTFLDHKNPFELLIAVILSAQCTDARVNIVTPALFKEFPTPLTLSIATHKEVADVIKSINFFNTKAKNIIKTSQILVHEYNSDVPASLKDLVTLPGVGRKTANVVLGQAFGIPGITVDTHVKRVSRRLGFTKKLDPVDVEFDLMKCWKKETWTEYSSVLILHGRSTCKAQNPHCHVCEFFDICPSKRK